MKLKLILLLITGLLFSPLLPAAGERQDHYEQVFAAATSFEAALKEAIAANGDDITTIIQAALAVKPELAEDVTRIALQTSPWLAEQIVNAAVGVLPDQATDIVTVAVNTSPANSDRIVKGAISAVLDPTNMAGEIVEAAVTAQPSRAGQIVSGAIAANRDSTYVKTVITAAVNAAPEMASQIEQQAIAENIDPEVVTQASAAGQVPSTPPQADQGLTPANAVSPVLVPNGGDGGGSTVSDS